MLMTGPFAMLSMPSFDFHLPPCTGGFLIHPSRTMAIATLAIATVSLGGIISLCIARYSKIYGALFDVHVFLNSEKHHQSVAFNSLATFCLFVGSSVMITCFAVSNKVLARVSKNSRPIFDTSYPPKYNLWYKIDNIFRNSKVIELFWYQIYPNMQSFDITITSNNNWPYTLYHKCFLSGHHDFSKWIIERSCVCCNHYAGEFRIDFHTNTGN